MKTKILGSALICCVALTSPSCRPRPADDASSTASFSVKSAAVDAAISKLNAHLAEYKNASTKQAKRAAKASALAFLSALDKTSTLRPMLVKLVALTPATASMDAATQASLAELVYDSLSVELANRDFDPWEAIDAKLMKAVRATDGLPLLPALERLTGESFVTLEQGQLLIDGEASWAKRDALIAAAKHKIWLFVWAIYDDKTGKDLAAQLLAKRDEVPGIDIRIIVDGPTGSKAGYKEPLQELIDRGIPAIRWNRADLKGYGMHRKVLIVDPEEGGAALFGGMNYGDNYSHKNESAPPLAQWRDTDMVVGGAAVRQAAETFARVWNDFVQVGGTLVSSANLAPATFPKTPRPPVVGEERFAFVDQYPSRIKHDPNYLDPVYLATLRLIESAQKSVDLSNAYFILSQPIEQALKRAADRGVQVRIHTNSDSSLTTEDKPLLGPIYASLARMLEQGQNAAGKARVQPEVYLQQTHTLHSKYMIVDGRTGWIGSYNIHPRSYRFEGESVGLFSGEAIGKQVQAMFDQDVSRSQKAALNDVTLPNATLYGLIGDFFFDQL